MNEYYISIGTNLGDRLKNIKTALKLLKKYEFSIEKQSSIYETEPEDYINQPNFYNMCIKVKTKYNPEEALSLLKKIEKEMGRVKSINKGPRIIDLDIILWNGGIYRSKNLIIPHPSYRKRKFVTIPLKEIEENLIDPETKKTIKEIIKNLKSEKKIKKV